MPSNLVRQAYEAKRASRGCMLQRIALTEAEIESVERYRDFLIGLRGKHQEELATFHQPVLEMLKGALDGLTMEETEDDVGFYHAVYADELVALTVAQGQVNQVESVVDWGDFIGRSSEERASSNSDLE